MSSMGIQTASSSSSSSSSLRRRHDVFLSFRGEDTRKKFTDHLHATLSQSGINTFKDDERLEKGKLISPELLKAIEDSKIVIIILSRNYASSRWCLDELAKIVECMNDRDMTVLPVFYEVDPSDVCNQGGSFAKAFVDHEENFKGDTKRVQRWKDAMREVANLSGWHVEDSYESKVVNDIVGKVLHQLNPLCSNVSKNLVGMDSRVKEILNLCENIRVDNASFVGIHGMGGIGKTTLARVIYERISFQFESSIFLANVREETRKHGIVALQIKLLTKLLVKREIEICDVGEGANMIQNRLCCKRILLILDDVDQLEQLDALARTQDWFGEGSVIIITTRNKRLLIEHHVSEDKIYKVEGLKYFEALQLFSWKAFNKDQPLENFMELSKQFLDYAKGHPLALKVLGSSLYNRKMDLWKSMLRKVRQNTDGKVQGILRTSFDELEEMEKNIFLDIACFFKGDKYNHVKDILESCGYHANIYMDNLINKSLIMMQGEILWLHDLLEDMGQDIVRLESPKEPGMRSRLYLREDIKQVLENNEGTEIVEGIDLKSISQEELYLNAKAFSKLKNLRLLRISNVHLSQGLSYLSNKLQVVEWHGYPLKSLPKCFAPDPLIELLMPNSHCKNIWKGKKDLYKLKILDLRGSPNLINTPDFIGLPNLEELILQDCVKLCKIHPSIGYLKQLILLNLRNCKSLRCLPYEISLKSLKILILSGCSKFKKFPEIVEDMKCLSELYLDGTAIKELPLSIEHLIGLTLLNLENCKGLLTTSVISSLTSLQSVNLSGTLISDKLPNKRNVECLEELDIRGTAIRQEGCFTGYKWQRHTSPFFSHQSMQNRHTGLVLPTTLFSDLCSLTELKLSNCKLSDESILNNLSKLLSLQRLDLSGNKFEYIPESISLLSKLKEIHLKDCRRLRSLPKLASSVQYAGIAGCSSLESYLNEFDVVCWDHEGGHIIRGTTSGFEDNKARIIRHNSRVELAIDAGRITYGFTSECEFRRSFENVNNGCVVKLQLNWDSDDRSSWLGCALYFLYQVHYHKRLACLGNSVPGSSEIWPEFVVYFDTDEGPVKQPLLLDCDKNDPGLHGVWVYIPFYTVEGSHNVNKWSFVQASITSTSPSTEVQTCGGHLIHKRNAQDFVQLNSTFKGPSNFRGVIYECSDFRKFGRYLRESCADGKGGWHRHYLSA